MKKISFVPVFCFLFLTIQLFSPFIAPLYAQDDNIAWDNGDQNVTITPDEDVVWVYEIREKKKVKEDKEFFRVPDRKYEVGVFNFSSGFSNDFMTGSEIFKENVEMNIDKLSAGFNLNVNLALSPIYFSYNKDDIWGIGLSTGLDMIGIIGLNGNMLTFNEADAAGSEVGAAAFAEVKIHSLFTYEKFKIKIEPSAYYPILYAKPNKFSYTLKNINTDSIVETIFNIGLDMQVYTAFPIEGGFEFTGIDSITAKPGFDIGIGAEYPLSETLGLIEKYYFLDFDVGIDFFNIPLYPSEMEDYLRMTVNLGSDEPINFFNGTFGDDSEENNIDNFYNYKIDDYGKEKRTVFRPFKMLVSANWRPLDNPSLEDSDVSFKIKREWLTLTPILGFAINPLYSRPISFEGGIRTRLNLSNLFIATLGIGYHDRLWKNSLDIAFNFRIYEIDLGINMQSTRFAKSWLGGGVGVTFGLKFGW